MGTTTSTTATGPLASMPTPRAAKNPYRQCGFELLPMVTIQNEARAHVVATKRNGSVITAPDATKNPRQVEATSTAAIAVSRGRSTPERVARLSPQK